MISRNSIQSMEKSLGDKMSTNLAIPGSPAAWTAIKIIHYTLPALLSLYFLLSFTVVVCTLQSQRLRAKDPHVHRGMIFSWLSLLTGAYFAEVVGILAAAAMQAAWTFDQDLMVYLIGSGIFFGMQVLALSDHTSSPGYPYYGTWFIAALGELTLIVVCNTDGPLISSLDVVLIAIQVSRITALFLLIGTYFGFYNRHKTYKIHDAERQSLLRRTFLPKFSVSEDSTTGNGSYGGTTNTNNEYSTTTDTTSTGSDSSTEEQNPNTWVSGRLTKDGNWWTYAKGFSIFLPYIWPTYDFSLQFRAILIVFTLLAANALNVALPTQLGAVIDTLSKYAQGDINCNIWLPVALYTVLRFINGGGCIGYVQKWLWLPIEQHTYNALSVASHAHLMNLSSDFHENKISSDLLQAIHGGRSVLDLLETVCFQIVPMFIDLAVAFAYLWSLFGPYMGLILAATVISYFSVTTRLLTKKADKRRDYIMMYRNEWTTGQQSLDGWTAASLFNRIPYECEKYASAVTSHMKTRKTYELSSLNMTGAQGLIMTSGLFGALCLGVYRVAYNGETIGKFSILIAYWAQLQAPLVYFSTMYRGISYSLMDAECLLKLFQTKPTIRNSSTARPLTLAGGTVKFKGVSFAYDECKPTLKNVSFVVPSGKTIALVGETGGGKSTILKLIDRFYDVNDGTISIDGQDIREVTIESLREKIGVVPQEPTLFNDTIINNIRYARLEASDEEVYEACKAAAIHEKIMTFPNGYNSNVGDKGVKMSGGEKQRIAIARVILKQPEIILLDEATSAVDTETEQLIQKGLKQLCQTRTTFIVAHRLSTITRADRILVVMDGEIIEEGSHDELIRVKGKYQSLWSKQSFISPATKKSRSRSPQKADTSIINDLNPAQHTEEMAKALKSTSMQTRYESKAGHICEHAKKCSTCHTPEESKLKPNAPEFVPLNPKAGSSGGLKPPERKDFMGYRKVGPDFSKQVIKKEAKSVSNQEDTKSVNEKIPDSTRSSGLSNSLPTESSVANTDGSKAKRNRAPRRYVAKSEPPAQPQESGDGTQDSDITAVDSADGQTDFVQPVNRRVSAPSDPPIGLNDNHGTRARRNRHWRMKNRAANHSQSSTAATGSSHMINSGDMSSDGPTPPLAPVPSPAEGAPVISPKITIAPSY